MATAILLQNYSTAYSDNLFNEYMTFDLVSTNFTVVSGTGTAQRVGTLPFAGDSCLKLTNGLTSTTDLVVDINSSLGRFTADNDGAYFISFAVKNPEYNVTQSTGTVRIFKNGLSFMDIDFATGDVFDNWQVFYQTLELESGDYIDVRYIFDSNATSGVANNYIFIDGFKLEYNDRGLSLPSKYTFPVDYKKNGWNINKNFSATQNLLADTETLITFPNTINDAQGNLNLLDANGKFTPVQTQDVYHLNYRFTTIAPSINGAVLTIIPKSDTVQVKEGRRITLSDTDGAEEKWNYEFTIVVTGSAFSDEETDILTNGIELYGTCTEEVSITDKRLEAIRIFNAD